MAPESEEFRPAEVSRTRPDSPSTGNDGRTSITTGLFNATLKEAIARARRREKEARAERFYERVVADSLLTHKRLKLLDMASSGLHPGETWGNLPSG